MHLDSHFLEIKIVLICFNAELKIGIPFCMISKFGFPAFPTAEKSANY